MKKFAILTVMMISLFISVDMVQAGRAGNRQIKQQKRIHQELKSGELTPEERLRLERQQNQANQHIYHLKHKEIAK